MTYYSTDTSANTISYHTYRVYSGSADSTSGTISGTTWYNNTSFWSDYGKQLEQRLQEHHQGMLLNDFLEMWQKDNYRIIELETKELPNERTAKRYNVYSEERLNEYGNHLGFIVILDRAGKVVSHEIFNVRGN
jgi:hypothetical protein